MYAYLHNAGVDFRVSTGAADRLRALQMAESAVECAIAGLLEDDSPADGPWDAWFDNPSRYREVAMPDPQGGDAPYGWFTVFTGDGDPDAPALRYGAQDEAAKINLNTATREMLLKLSPRVTEEIADAIIDWRDGDDKPGPSGAESSYYLTLTPPYRCKNAPFESVEELLYVKGVDAAVLYGEDWNRNGVLDPAENDMDKNDPPDNADGRLDLGLWHLCTVYSYDRNVTNDGKPRVNISTASEEQLQSALGDALTNDQIQAIVRGRSQGPYAGVADLLDLPGWDVGTFQTVADRVTASDAQTLVGLVNVNTAPRAVLQALPGITEDRANAITAQRTNAQTPLTNIGWLLQAIDKAAFRQIANLVTVRAAQFSIQAVGWAPSRRGLAPVYGRVWAVVDLADGTPRMRAWKDLTPLGFPYPLEERAPGIR